MSSPEPEHQRLVGLALPSMDRNAVNQTGEQARIEAHQMVDLSQFPDVCFQLAPLPVLFCDPILCLCLLGLDHLTLGDQGVIPAIVIVLVLRGCGVKLNHVVDLLAKDVLLHLEPIHLTGNVICSIELRNSRLKGSDDLISPGDELIDHLDESRLNCLLPKVRRRAPFSYLSVLPIAPQDHAPIWGVAVLDLVAKERTTFSAY